MSAKNHKEEKNVKHYHRSEQLHRNIKIPTGGFGTGQEVPSKRTENRGRRNQGRAFCHRHRGKQYQRVRHQFRRRDQR